MTFSIGDMVERTIEYSDGLETIRGTIIKLDAVYIWVYWFHSGVEGMFSHRAMKDIITVVQCNST
jgi:hypothetical protein